VDSHTLRIGAAIGPSGPPESTPLMRKITM
jgi:hypothetical protein